MREPSPSLTPAGESRRGFLKKGLIGGGLLVAGSAGWLALRKPPPYLEGSPFAALTPEEASVLHAVAARLLPPHAGFPSIAEVGVVRRVDGILASAHPGLQKDVKQLLRLFDNALAGLVFDGHPRPFTSASPDEQDARLAAWARSRIAVRRTGYRALKRLVNGAYYSSPLTYAALGYAGPPSLSGAGETSAAPGTATPASRAGKTEAP